MSYVKFHSYCLLHFETLVKNIVIICFRFFWQKMSCNVFTQSLFIIVSISWMIRCWEIKRSWRRVSIGNNGWLMSRGRCDRRLLLQQQRDYFLRWSRRCHTRRRRRGTRFRRRVPVSGERSGHVQSILLVVVDLVLVVANDFTIGVGCQRRTDHQRIFNVRIVGSKNENSDESPKSFVLISRKLWQKCSTHFCNEFCVAVVLKSNVRNENETRLIELWKWSILILIYFYRHLSNIHYLILDGFFNFWLNFILK